MEFTVTLDRYEGPYTKLLDLINDRKLSITEISLASVTDEYIAYVKSLDGSDVADISQFVVVASTLMLMKAKSLLPGISYTEEEEKQVHDLEHKLELHRVLLAATQEIRSIYGVHVLYERERVAYKGMSVFVPDDRVTGALLQSIALLTLSTFTIPKQMVNVAIDQALRIETVIENLLTRIQSAGAVSLRSLASTGTSFAEVKKTLIVNFIALLELVRSGKANANQNEDGDILISHHTASA